MLFDSSLEHFQTCGPRRRQRCCAASAPHAPALLAAQARVGAAGAPLQTRRRRSRRCQTPGRTPPAQTCSDCAGSGRALRNSAHPLSQPCTPAVRCHAGPQPAPSSTSTATRKRALRRAPRHGGLTPPVPAPGSPGSTAGRGLVGGVARRSKPRSTPFETAPWASLPGRSVSRSGRHPAASSGRAGGVRCVVAGCLAGPGRCIQQGGNCLSAKPRAWGPCAQTIFNRSAPTPQAAGEDPNGRWPRPQSSAKKPTGLQTFPEWSYCLMPCSSKAMTHTALPHFADERDLACPA
jgi:hypothetical protein